MANNLFISYDLMAPGQHYDSVQGAIKALGNWGKVELSMFYVKSALNSEQAAKHVWASMTPNDKLIVIDTTNNDCYGFNVGNEAWGMVQSEWNK